MTYNYIYSTQSNVQIISVTYGNKRITHERILWRIKNDLFERQNAFKVTNEDLGGDPHLRISAAEGDYLHFSVRVSRVKYRGVELYDKPEVVERLNLALFNTWSAQNKTWKFFESKDEGKLRLDNWAMGGDTQVGVKKKAEIQLLSRSDFEFYWDTYDEGEMFPHTERQSLDYS